MKNADNLLIAAHVVVAELPPSALALHHEAVEYFAAGHTMLQAANSYATASDTYYHRGIVWIIANGYHLLPANDKGKAPSIKGVMETISTDSKNGARQMLQEIYSLAWQANDKGLDPLAFASLRAMRDGVRAKDKTLPNDTVAGSLADAPEAVEAPEAPEAVKLTVNAEEVAQMVEDRAILEAVRAELSKAKPSIKALRELVAA
jgi:hypothetical protein